MDAPDEKNMLHEFVKGEFDDAAGVEDVVESVLGSLGYLRRGAHIVDATVQNREDSVLNRVAARYGMILNERIEQSDVDPRDIVCAVAFNPCNNLIPVTVLTPTGGDVPGYTKAYSSEHHTVFIRRDLARRAGLTSLQIMLG